MGDPATLPSYLRDLLTGRRYSLYYVGTLAYHIPQPYDLDPTSDSYHEPLPSTFSLPVEVVERRVESEMVEIVGSL